MPAGELDKKVGILIKNWRQTRRMKQHELGEQVGLSRASVSNIERGAQQLTVLMLYKIAGALEMPPVELLPNFKVPSQKTPAKREAYTPEQEAWLAEADKKAIEKGDDAQQQRDQGKG